MSEEKKQEEEKDLVIPKIQAPELLRTLKLHRGHTLWEYNTLMNILSKAKLTPENRKVNEHNTSTAKLVGKPGCIYISALNKKNAIRKLSKNYDTTGINFR